MKKITQQNLILSLIENIVRSNIYVFILFRFLANQYFSKYVFESDFKVLKYFKNFQFYKNKCIIDIGGNDGISIKSIRNFTNNYIYSFEPDPLNFKKISILKKKDKKLSVFRYGLSDKNVNNIKFYQPFYKKFHLSPFDSLQRTDVLQHLKSSLFIKNIEKKIIIRKKFINLKKLDFYNLNPCFIKIDIQGHEYKCVLGSLKTIRRSKPLIMVEYDKIESSKIFLILSKMGYKKYYYKSGPELLIEHKNERVFNLFFIHKEIFKNKIIKLKKLNYDNYKT